MNFRHIFYLFFFVFIIKNSAAQNQHNSTPFIQNYSPQDYNAGNQNWAIVQDDRGIMYFGNNKGLLEFDGRSWRMIDPSYIVCAEKNSEGKIFVGGKQVFGFLEPDNSGIMKLNKLNYLIPDSISATSYLRYILFIDEVVYFFDESGWLIKYRNDNDTKIEKISEWIGMIALIDNQIIMETRQGLSIYENNQIKLLKEGDKIADKNIQTILKFNNKTLIITRQKGVFVYDSTGINEWHFETSEYLKKSQIYKATKIQNEFLVFGTVENGVVVVDSLGNKVLQLDSNSGMINHDHCAIYIDDKNNIWSGLEYGISHIQFNSPYSYFNELNGLNNSAIYSIELFNDTLYVGTAQGVYQAPWQTKYNTNSKVEFTEIKGNNGRKAWDFLIDDGNVLCGSSNIGTYRITNDRALKIVPKHSADKMIKTKSSVILCSAEHGGLFTIKNSHKNWEFIKFFDEISFVKYIEEDSDGNFWLDIYQKGIARITFNEQYNNILNIQYYTEKDGLPTKDHLTVLKLNNEILIGTDDGTYIYDKQHDNFRLYNEFNDKLRYNSKIKSFHYDIDNNLWFWGSDNHMEHIGIVNIIDKNVFEIESQQNSLAHLSNLENFSFYPITREHILIGSSDKLILFNSKHAALNKDKLNLSIRSVEVISGVDSLIFGGTFTDYKGNINNTQGSSQEQILDHTFNELRFKYAALDFLNPLNIKYSYLLEGFDKEWSEYSNKAEKEYTNLPAGNYQFKVQAKDIYNIESNIASYKFTILPPWYNTKFAYIIFFLSGVFLIYLIVKLSILRIERDRKKLEKLVTQRTQEISKQRDEIQHQRDEIESQHDTILFHRKKLIDSIDYAKQIQGALLPPEKKFNEFLKDYFLLYQPKDIVSGDFYWLKKVRNSIIIAAADCTGHGVPGAFMSILGISFLNEILRQQELNTPALVLEELRDKTISSFHQLNEIDQNEKTSESYFKSSITDGIDIAICAIDQDTKMMEYAGANSPIYIVRNNEIIETEPTINPIGIYVKYVPFTNQRIQLLDGDVIYLFSDGYADQFGGINGDKFNITNYKKLLIEIHQKPFNEQKEILENRMKEWKGSNNQVDDMMVIGIKI
jgi:serine phosphatase RsbU (regulator of sigma subunit)/ligand-binding sensor domain-containing protein